MIFNGAPVLHDYDILSLFLSPFPVLSRFSYSLSLCLPPCHLSCLCPLLIMSVSAASHRCGHQCRGLLPPGAASFLQSCLLKPQTWPLGASRYLSPSPPLSPSLYSPYSLNTHTLRGQRWEFPPSLFHPVWHERFRFFSNEGQLL